MQTSTNYGFKLPESSDPVSVSDINYNFSKIDGNLNDWVGDLLGNIVDDTLTTSGYAADAKVTGDRIAAIVSPSGAHTNDVMHIDANGNMVPVAFSNYLASNNIWESGKAAEAMMVYDYINSYTQKGSGQANRVYVTNNLGYMTTSNTAASIIKLTNYVVPTGRVTDIVATDSVLTAIEKLAYYVNNLRDRVAALEAASSGSHSSL